MARIWIRLTPQTFEELKTHSIMEEFPHHAYRVTSRGVWIQVKRRVAVALKQHGQCADDAVRSLLRHREN